MSTRRSRWPLFALLLLLGLSTASFGFLVGRSHQVQVQDTAEQLQLTTTRVQTTTAVVARGADFVRRLLLR